MLRFERRKYLCSLTAKPAAVTTTTGREDHFGPGPRACRSCASPSRFERTGKWYAWRWLHLTAWLLGTAVGCAACATHADKHEGPEGPPLHVRLGPTIRLLPFQKAYYYDARALIDAQGQVHVLAASFEPPQVEEIVVDPDRVLERRVVTAISRTFGWNVRLDEAFDAQGRLHALVNDQHFLLADTGWVQSKHTPWDEAGTKAEDVAFVHGAPGLIFRFQGSGNELGARAHWEVWGFGNAMGGLVWPWRTHGTRTVIVPEIDSAYPVWTVIEPNDKHNTLTEAAVADDKSSVCLIYEKVVGGLLSTLDELWFGCVPGLDAQTARTSAPAAVLLNTKASPKLTDRILMRSFAGAAMPVPPYRIAPRSLAVDPHTGSVLAGAQWLRQGEGWQGPLPGSSVIAGHGHVIAAGGDSFHGVAITQGAHYILYSRLSPDHTWSQPLQVGKAYFDAPWTKSNGPPPSRRYTDIAATADGRVFIVWPAAEGLVGCWVENVQ